MHTHTDKDARTRTYIHKQAHAVQNEQFLLPLYTPSPTHIIMDEKIMLAHLYILRVRICLRMKRVRVRVWTNNRVRVWTNNELTNELGGTQGTDAGVPAVGGVDNTIYVEFVDSK